MTNSDDRKLSYRKDPPKPFEGFEDALEKNKRTPLSKDSFWNKYSFWIKFIPLLVAIILEVMFGSFVDWFVKSISR